MDLRKFRLWAMALLLGGALSPALGAAPAQLVVALGGEPETGFDPLAGWGSYGVPLFQATLIGQGDDLAPTPDLAQHWQLSADRLTWELTLREGLRFSDGTPLTARDVAFTFNAAKAAPGGPDLSMMIAAEALSDRQVRIRLHRPWISFFDHLQRLGIVPEASYGPGYGRAPVGAGPLRLRAWQEGTQLVAEPNPHYHGARVRFEQITFLFAAPDAALAAAAAGEVHLVALPARSGDLTLPGFRRHRVASVDNRGLSLPFPPPQKRGGRAIGHAVTSDPAIRAAINRGIDRALLVEVALHGHGTPAAGPADGLPWSGEAAIAFDPEGARALLDQAGWLPGRDGIRSRNGLRAHLTLHYPAADPTRQALAEVLVELLRPLGIAAEVKGASWSLLRSVMGAEPLIFGFGSHSAYELYTLYHSSRAGVEYQNPGHYANGAVDALFERAQAAPDPAQAAPIWAEAAAHYGAKGDNAWAWLVNLDHLYLAHDCLDLGRSRLEPHAHGWPIMANLSDWRWRCP